MKIGVGALPLILGNYARKYGIRLFMDGDSAWTNGSVISIPRVNDDDPEAMTLSFGYVGHETGHIRFTDFGLASEKGIKGGTTLFSLLNSLEDSRVERLQVDTWPGMKNTFDHVLKTLRIKLYGVIRSAKRNGDLTTLVILYCGFRAHEDWTTSPSLRGLRRASQLALRSILPAAAVSAIDRLLKGVSYKENTGEVLKVAEKVLKFIQKLVRKNNEELDKQQNQQQNQNQGQPSQGQGQGGLPNQGEGQDESQEGDQDGEGQDESRDDGQDGEGQDEDQDESQDQSQGQSKGRGSDQTGDLQDDLSEQEDDPTESQDQSQSQSSSGQAGDSNSSQEADLFSGQPQPAPRKKPSLSRLMKEFDLDSEAVKELEKEFNPSERMDFSNRFNPRNLPSLEKELRSRSFDSDCLIGGSLTPGFPQPGDDGELFRRVSGGNFRVQVNDLMKAYDEWLNGTRDSGRILDVRAYGNRILNNFKVFKTRKVKQAVNTSVTLLVDCSGSMDRHDPRPRYQVAEECAMALALGMESCSNLSREVVYFPGTGSDYDDICTKDQSVRNRARYYARDPDGGTPLTQGLLHAVERLPEKNPLQRNIIFVFTDGAPDDRYSAAKVIERCTELGIEVYGIGIGANAEVEELPFLATETVLESTELPAAMKRLMKRALFQKNVCGNIGLAKQAALKMARFGC